MAVARGCGKRAQTVSNWITRESIPLGHWPKLFELGFTEKELLAAHLDMAKAKTKEKTTTAA